MFTQARWRLAGGITIALCGGMAWFSTEIQALRQSLLLFSLYWGVFVFLFVLTLYIVVLDLRYIRMESAIAQRELFRETLDDEDFRRTLRSAIHNANDSNRPPET